MKILVPLNEFHHFEGFYEAGAREFYLGFYDEEWSRKYGIYHDINRLSGFGKMANQYSLQELCQEIEELGHRRERTETSIYLTINASVYSTEQMKDLKDYIERLAMSGIDGVIVSSLELTMLAKEIGIPAVISTIAGVYNADAVKVYQEHGAKRVILPRDLSIEEIRTIVEQVPEMEYEIFLMRNGCAFSDSNCLGFHRQEMCSVCSSLSRAKVSLYPAMDYKTEHDTLINHEIYGKYFHDMTCGLCAIYRFLQMGISACKIVGRAEEYEAICKDIRYVANNMGIARRCKSEDEYLSLMQFPDNKQELCRLGLSCYYPEVRF